MNDPKDKGEPFLSRWARRKQDASRGRTDEAAPDTAQVDEAPAVVDAAAPRDADKEPELDLSKLPKAEELTAESDITAFLDKRVPAMLRNAALGRMWTLDPTIRDFIEVAENQWNWNIPGGAPFYEPIESVVEGAGEIVAQLGNQAGDISGNTIARAIEAPNVASGNEAALSRADCSGAELKYESQKIEPKANRAAPQNDTPTLDGDLASSVVIGDAYESGTSNEAVADTASQHHIAESLINRRRHGGALPG